MAERLDRFGVDGEAGVLEPAGSPREITRRSLAEEAVIRLRRLIIEERMAPGTKLREKELCDQFGISRTPLREALKALESEGLVEILPNKGAQVAQISSEEIRQSFDVLAVLEGHAGKLAAEHASDEAITELRSFLEQMKLHHAAGDREPYFALNQAIHAAIIRAAGSGVLQDLHKKLNARVRWARLLANFTQERWDKAVAEHEEIQEALEARDGDGLARLLEEHLRTKYISAAALEHLRQELGETGETGGAR